VRYLRPWKLDVFHKGVVRSRSRYTGCAGQPLVAFYDGSALRVNIQLTVGYRTCSRFFTRTLREVHHAFAAWLMCAGRCLGITRKSGNGVAQRMLSARGSAGPAGLSVLLLKRERQ
jgi:hypothetical protein